MASAAIKPPVPEEAGVVEVAAVLMKLEAFAGAAFAQALAAVEHGIAPVGLGLGLDQPAAP
jgi:hypothetical protein